MFKKSKKTVRFVTQMTVEGIGNIYPGKVVDLDAEKAEKYVKCGYAEYTTETPEAVPDAKLKQADPEKTQDNEGESLKEAVKEDKANDGRGDAHRGKGSSKGKSHK